MENSASPHCDSDEEVFWGPVTAREIELMWRRKNAEKNIVRTEGGVSEISVQERENSMSEFGTVENLVASGIEELKNLSLSENVETPGVKEIIPSDLKFIDEEENSLNGTEVEKEDEGSVVGGSCWERKVIIVGDYSIISSDGESGSEDPKTYTVLKPLVEAEPANSYARVTEVEPVVSVLPYSLEDPRAAYAERVTVIEDSDSESTSDSQNRMSPGLVSVTSGEQYFDADNNNATAFKDCSASSAGSGKSFLSLKGNDTPASDSLVSFRTVVSDLVVPEAERRREETLGDDVVSSPDKMEIADPQPETISSGIGEDRDLNFASLCKGSVPQERTGVLKRPDMRYRDPKTSRSPLNTPSPLTKKPKVKTLGHSSSTSHNPLLKPPAFQYPPPQEVSTPNSKKAVQSSSKSRTPLKPSTPVSHFRKPLPLSEIPVKKTTEPSRLTPSKSPATRNLYKNIKSPVAGYIHSSSIPVIIKKVHPTEISVKKFNECLKNTQERNPNAENIDSTNTNSNANVVSSLKPACHILSDKVLVVEKVVKSQLPRMGKTQQKILCSSSSPVPKVIMHKGSIKNPVSKKVEEKLVSRSNKERSQLTDFNQDSSYAKLPNIIKSDISVLETYKYDTDLKK